MSDSTLTLTPIGHVHGARADVEDAKIIRGARHPRNNPAWPLTGILAQRAKNRPNRIGSTICRGVRRERRTLLPMLALSLALLGLGCATPEGPLMAMPPQRLTEPAPTGKARVVFFNTSSKLLYFESGPIKIQLNGQQVPSIWLEHYVQVFVEPGTYPLHLEHYDAVMWKSSHTIEIQAPDTFVEVWNRPTSTRFKIVEALPADFSARFKPRGPKE